MKSVTTKLTKAQRARLISQEMKSAVLALSFEELLALHDLTHDVMNKNIGSSRRSDLAHALGVDDEPAVKSLWTKKSETGRDSVRVIGIVERYVVARYKGCAPFLVPRSEWRAEFEPLSVTAAQGGGRVAA